jgi:hypothetical protein
MTDTGGALFRAEMLKTRNETIKGKFTVSVPATPPNLPWIEHMKPITMSD